MAFSIIAATTDLARQRIAQMLISGKSFQVNEFSIGDAGHDPMDPTVALTPDVTLVNCPSTLFGPEPIDSATLITPYCIEFVCVVGASEYAGPVSNICLLGQIVYPPTDIEYGSYFLYAIGNFPLQTKVIGKDMTLTVTITF